MSVAIQAVGLVVGFIGMSKQAKAQKKAAKAAKQSARAQNRARKAQQRIAERKNLQSRRESIRQSRIARAQVIQAGAAAGVGASSGVAGGVANIQTEGASSLGFFSNVAANTAAANVALEQSSEFDAAVIQAQNQASTGAAIVGFGGTIFSNSGKLANMVGQT